MGWLAQAVDKIGTALNLPEWGISERLNNGTYTANTGVTPQSQAAGLDTWKEYHWPTQTNSTTTTQPTNTSNSGGGQVLGVTSPVPTGDSGSSSTSSPNSVPTFSRPSDEQINAVYNPIFNSLNSQAQQATDFYNQEKGYLEEQKTNQLDKLSQQELSAQEIIAAQKAEFKNQIESALSQAVRAYNALNQRGNVLYGRSTGTGQAMGELASREYFRNQGQIRQTEASELGKIQKSVRDTELFFINAEKEMDAEYKKSFTGLFKSYQDAMNSINTMREATESQKRAYKLEVNANVDALKNQLLASRQQQKDQLTAWKAMRDYELAQEYQAMSAGMYQTSQGLFSNAEPTLNFVSPEQNTSDDLALLRSKASQANYKDDEDTWYV